MFPGSNQRGITLPNLLVKARHFCGKMKTLLGALAWKIVEGFVAA